MALLLINCCTADIDKTIFFSFYVTPYPWQQIDHRVAERLEMISSHYLILSVSRWLKSQSKYSNTAPPEPLLLKLTRKHIYKHTGQKKRITTDL